jgi:hypothetical protein
MIFLIENTQNRDSAALHLKLDELIRINEAARYRRQMFCQLMTMMAVCSARARAPATPSQTTP